MSLKPPRRGEPGFNEWRDLADAVDAAGVLGAGHPRPRIDANELERMAKERPDARFLKGSGILKLIGGIRQLEGQLREKEHWCSETRQECEMLRSALRKLHGVCLGMDLERQDDRPAEEDYQEAMQFAALALGEHTAP